MIAGAYASPPHRPFHLGQAYRVRSRLAAGASGIRTLGTRGRQRLRVVLFSYSGVPVPARNNNSTERDQRFESDLLQRRVYCEPGRPGPGGMAGAAATHRRLRSINSESIMAGRRCFISRLPGPLRSVSSIEVSTSSRKRMSLLHSGSRMLHTTQTYLVVLATQVASSV